MNKFRKLRAQLADDDIKDPYALWQWLWDQVKGWKDIATKVELIRDAKIGSRKKTFEYLWSAMDHHVTHCYEDANYMSLLSDPNDTKNRDAYHLSITPKGKNKGKDKGKGKGKRKEGKSKRSVTPSANSDAAQIAKSTPAADRTQQQNKLILCRLLSLENS